MKTTITTLFKKPHLGGFRGLMLLCLLAFTGTTKLNAQWSQLGGNNSLTGNLAIGGVFTDALGNTYASVQIYNGGNSYSTYVAKHNGSTWSILLNMNAFPTRYLAKSICGDAVGNIYVAVGNENVGGSDYVLKYNGNTWSRLGSASGTGYFPDGFIQSICSDPAGNIYAAGNITNANNYGYVAKYNGSTWSELGGTNALSASGFISSICSDAAGNIYAAGSFTNDPGNPTANRYVAKYNGSTWSELGGTDALAANDEIHSICSDAAGNIYAAGYFKNAIGNYYVAKYDGNNWSELGDANYFGALGDISAICSNASGNIYASGLFTNSSGKQYVAKYNGTSWSELGGSNSLAGNGNIYSLSSDAWGNIYAAGYITNSSGNVYVAKYTCANTSITNLTICTSQLPYSWNGVTFTVAGSKTAHLTNAEGCDSAAALNLTTVNTLPPITGVASVCVAATTQLANVVSGGVWGSIAGRATINTTGLVTGTSGGTATIVYKLLGCGSRTANVVVGATPNIPSIAYAVGTVNPQTGAGGAFCTNKNFTVVGTPTAGGGATGVWSSTLITVSVAGIVNTGNTPGAASLTYTYTSAAGCSNSRTISANVVATCAARGVNGNQLVASSDFTIYPNPARSVVSLNVETLIGSGQIVVTDLYGKQVKMQSLSMGNNKIDVSSLSKGMYFISTITNEGKTTKKLVVE